MTGTKHTENTKDTRLGRIGSRPYGIFVFSILVRAVHQVGAAVFLGSLLLNGTMNIPRIYWIIVGVSGVILMITEGMRHRQFLRELAGVSTLVKLVLLGTAYHGWIPATPVMLFSFVLASICSHAPKTIRHRLLF